MNSHSCSMEVCRTVRDDTGSTWTQRISWTLQNTHVKKYDRKRWRNALSRWMMDLPSGTCRSIRRSKTFAFAMNFAWCTRRLRHLSLHLPWSQRWRSVGELRKAVDKSLSHFSQTPMTSSQPHESITAIARTRQERPLSWYEVERSLWT